MSNDHMLVGLISDPETVAETCAAVCAAVGHAGSILICNGCGDIAAPIVALLILDDDEEAWALCADCLGEGPLLGAVA